MGVKWIVYSILIYQWWTGNWSNACFTWTMLEMESNCLDNWGWAVCKIKDQSASHNIIKGKMSLVCQLTRSWALFMWILRNEEISPFTKLIKGIKKQDRESTCGWNIFGVLMLVKRYLIGMGKNILWNLKDCEEYLSFKLAWSGTAHCHSFYTPL